MLDATSQSAMQPNSPTASIAFPLFDDPSTIINMLLGQDVNLVTFKVPEFNIPGPSIGVGIDIPLPIPLLTANVTFSASMSIGAEIEVGYDTYGLHEVANAFEQGQTPSANTIAGDLADGFYIQGPTSGDPGTHISITGDLKVTAGAGVGYEGISATLDFGGALEATIGLGINTNGAADGKVRLSTLESDLASGTNILTFSGDLTANFDVEVDFELGPLTPHVTLYSFPPITIWQSSSAEGELTAGTPPPTITGVTPASGGMNGSGFVPITIYGTNLENATHVYFDFPDPGGGMVEVPNIVDDEPGYITVDTPAAQGTVDGPLGGTVDVQVTTGSGTSAINPTDEFTYVPPPSLTNIDGDAEYITPQSGPTSGGTEVTILGQNSRVPRRSTSAELPAQY